MIFKHTLMINIIGHNNQFNNRRNSPTRRKRVLFCILFVIIILIIVLFGLILKPNSNYFNCIPDENPAIETKSFHPILKYSTKIPASKDLFDEDTPKRNPISTQEICDELFPNDDQILKFDKISLLNKLATEIESAVSDFDKFKTLTKVFNLVDIKDFEYKEKFIDSLNEKFDFKVENIHNFYIFKISKDGNLYVLKQITYSKKSWEFSKDLLAEEIDSPYVAKIIKVFGKNEEYQKYLKNVTYVKNNIPVGLDKNKWVLSEYPEVGLDDVVKRGGLEMIKKIASDTLLGLKNLHEK